VFFYLRRVFVKYVKEGWNGRSSGTSFTQFEKQISLKADSYNPMRTSYLQSYLQNYLLLRKSIFGLGPRCAKSKNPQRIPEDMPAVFLTPLPCLGSNLAFLATKVILQVAPFLVLFLSLLTSQGCVLPPRGLEPVLLNPKEARFLTLVQEARVSISSRNLAKAEEDLRLARILMPDVSSAANDLGVVLMRQGRLDEASEMFRTAIGLDDKNLAAWDNLARVLYREDKINEAVEIFEKVLDVDSGLQADKNLNAAFDSNRRALLYRNLAQAYLISGYPDDALCYSSLAATTMANPYEWGEHVRMLMDLHLWQKAFQIQTTIATQYGLAMPTEVLLDYAVNALHLGQNDLVRDLVSFFVTDKNASGPEHGFVMLLGVLVGGDDETKFSEPFQEFVSSMPELCKDPRSTLPSYWPNDVVNSFVLLMDVYCANGK